ncbi:MAG: hypothetical protein JZU63_08850, partial [Rhodoferax sp.]|nr:hypothetical protein [Rhodoferax sp.]
YLQDQSGISFQALGRAVRRLSLKNHREFLIIAAECCLDDLSLGLKAFTGLATRTNKGESQDAGIQKEQQIFADVFRLVAEKILDPSMIRESSTHEDGGGGGGGGGTKSSSNSGHLGGHQTIRLLAPPEDLPEFVNWIPSDEVLGEPDADDTQEDEGVEAPRRTGLKLVDPADLKGHLARAKTQSHHLAMQRQGFPWDQNTLSPSERQVLVNLVDRLRAGLTDSVPDEWWPKAMVATAWVCGRSLEDVLSLACLTGDELRRVE